MFGKEYFIIYSQVSGWQRLNAYSATLQLFRMNLNYLEERFELTWQSQQKPKKDLLGLVCKFHLSITVCSALDDRYMLGKVAVLSVISVRHYANAVYPVACVCLCVCV